MINTLTPSTKSRQQSAEDLIDLHCCWDSPKSGFAIPLSGE